MVRDLPELAATHGRRRHPDALRRYLSVCALHTAGVVPDTALAHAAGVDRRTAVGYHDTLNILRLVADVPAWHSNRLKRLTSMPKRLLADSGLAAWLIGTDTNSIRQDHAVRGRIIETFVAAQLRVEVESARRRTSMFHLRTQGGEHEIDLVVEFGMQLAAFEVKTSSSPSASDARHLSWLRDSLPPEQFAGGVVFHTGARRYGLGDRIEAMPIAALWG